MTSTNAEPERLLEYEAHPVEKRADGYKVTMDWIVRLTCVGLFSCSLVLFVMACRRPAYRFDPWNGGLAKLWSGTECLRYGFLFYPSNLFLWATCGVGLVATLSGHRARVLAAAFLPGFLVPTLISTSLILYCWYAAGKDAFAGFNLWVISHVAYLVGQFILTVEFIPHHQAQRARRLALERCRARWEATVVQAAALEKFASSRAV